MVGGSKIVSVYMVYLQGRSQQFEINVTLHFIINFEISLVNLLNVLVFFCFWHLKKRRLYIFNLLFFRFIAFSMIMVHGYCSWNIFNDLFKFLRFLKSYFQAILQFPSQKKNTHTPPPCFSLKNHGQKFFLNHLFLQFNSKINRGFFCKQFPCEEIRRILLCKNKFCKSIYLPKCIFRKNLFL